MSITQKRRMSIWAYVLIGLLIVGAIVLVVLHIAGIVDLSFVAEGFMGIMAWASADAVNGALLLAATFAGGMITWYALATYIIGTKIQTTYNQPAYGGGYNPQPTQPSQPQQDNETVIS